MLSTTRTNSNRLTFKFILHATSHLDDALPVTRLLRVFQLQYDLLILYFSKFIYLTFLFTSLGHLLWFILRALRSLSLVSFHATGPRLHETLNAPSTYALWYICVCVSHWATVQVQGCMIIINDTSKSWYLGLGISLVNQYRIARSAEVTPYICVLPEFVVNHWNFFSILLKCTYRTLVFTEL